MCKGGIKQSPNCGRVAGIVLAILPVLGSAHHSRAEYSRDTTVFEGEFVEVTWTNPHPTFTFRVMDADGTESVIVLQAWGSPYTLQRAGVEGVHFRAGVPVRIAARESTRRENRYVLTHALLPNGLEVVLNLNEQPLWSENSIGSQTDYFASDDEILGDTASENRGIFRVWSVPAQPEPGTFETRYELTEAGAAIKAEYDPLNDFAARCVQPGMPRFMSNPAAYEFRDNGINITIRNAHYDLVRTIHIADAEDPELQPTGPLGYSVGRWEEDALVVRTTRIDFPFFDLVGTPAGESPEVVERFRLSEDQARLDYESTTTEPSTFMGAATIRRYWIALGEDVPPPEYAANCERIGSAVPGGANGP